MSLIPIPLSDVSSGNSNKLESLKSSNLFVFLSKNGRTLLSTSIWLIAPEDSSSSESSRHELESVSTCWCSLMSTPGVGLIPGFIP